MLTEWSRTEVTAPLDMRGSTVCLALFALSCGPRSYTVRLPSVLSLAYCSLAIFAARSMQRLSRRSLHSEVKTWCPWIGFFPLFSLVASVKLVTCIVLRKVQHPVSCVWHGIQEKQTSSRALTFQSFDWLTCSKEIYLSPDRLYVQLYSWSYLILCTCME